MKNNPNKAITVVKTRSLSQANIQLFKENLDAQNFQFINNIESPNTAYDEFMKIYSAISNKSFPLHESNSSRFLKRQPWLTSSCTKAKLFPKKLNKPTFENIERYKSFNNTFNTLKWKRQILEEHKHDSTKCWSILKQAIGKLSNKSSFPTEFLINNISGADKKEIAEKFQYILCQHRYKP